MSRRALPVVGLVLSALAGCSGGAGDAAACLLLSPECAKAEASLRLDIVNLPGDTTRVRADVAGQSRETDRITDHAVTFYFFEVPEHADVAVYVEGGHRRHCEVHGVPTGRGQVMTLNADDDDECEDDDGHGGADSGNSGPGGNADAGHDPADGGAPDVDAGCDNSGHGNRCDPDGGHEDSDGGD